MNILHINYSDILGARFNGYDMMCNSTDSNVHYSMMVWRKKSDNPNVFELPPRSKALKWCIETALHLMTKLGLGYMFSFFGLRMLRRTKQYREADIVHLQIIHGDTNIGITDIPRLCKEKKIVWTFHDQWALSGGCIHPFSCDGIKKKCKRICPYPRYQNVLNKYTARLLQQIKSKNYLKSNFEIVVSTPWMAEKVKNSRLFNNVTPNIIPFGLDSNSFINRGKENCRVKLGIPADDFVIAIRFTGAEDKMKGFQYAKEALFGIPSNNVTIIVFEKEGGLEELKNSINVVETGWIDENSLVDYLSASDIFLMPSLQESFGLMAIEAMACETPVIAAEGTSLPNIVKDDIGGIIVPARDSEAIKSAIVRCMGDKQYLHSLSLGARNRVIENYTLANYISQHESLYKSIISR